MTAPTPVVFAWLGMAVFSLVMYVCLDGFDLGIGMLLLLPRQGTDRKEMVEIVATAWDANESWLVLAGIALFGGFPLAYSTWLPALYVPLVAMLLALIIRGVAIEYQSQSERYDPAWGAVFAFGSLVAALCQGAIAGAVLPGIPVANHRFAGGPFTFAHPLSILTAAWLVGTYLLIGAAWLNDKTSGELQAWSKRVLRRGAAPVTGLAAAALLLGFVTGHGAPHGVSPRLSAVIAAALASGAFFWAGARATRETADSLPFVWNELALLSVALGFAACTYPYLVPPAVTFWQAAAPATTVNVLLIGVGCCMPIVLAYNAYAYHVFRGKFVIPLPTQVVAMAPPRRMRRRSSPAATATLQASIAGVSETVTPLAWLRNVGWVAVWVVLYFFCLGAFGSVLGDRGTVAGILVLIAAMVAVWILTDRRDLVP